MVVPLKDLIAYVSFHQSGRLNIRGFITNLTKSQAKSKYLSKYDGEYENTVLSSDGEEWLDYLRYRHDGPGNSTYSKFSLPVVVDVPKQAFAKEPPQWEQAWVNHFFRQRPNDQCDYRRRRMFAYTIQPFIMMGNIALRAMVLLLALLVGARGISLNNILHPLTYSLPSALDMLIEGSVFVSKNNYYSSDVISEARIIVKKYWKLTISPPVLIMIGLLWLKHLLIGFAIFIAFISFITFIIGTVALLITRFSKISKFVEKVINKLESGNNTNYWYEDKQSIDLLSCDGKTKTLSTLPANRKSIKLRFLDVKSKVCRPFSR